MPQPELRWLIASYDPVSLFSLRMTNTSSKGGKTLVVPTPYVVKMELIDACFRAEDGERAEVLARRVFGIVKMKRVRFLPPPHCVVQNTFVKALDADREGGLPFKQTIVYREFAAFAGGPLLIALETSGLSGEESAVIGNLFWHINSLGKRGSFWQCVDVTHQSSELVGYSAPLQGEGIANPELLGMTQLLDDFGEELCAAKDGFERISTFGSGSITLGKHRVLVTTALPYYRRSSSKRFTWYERTTPGETGHTT
jgi:hypothetical protein